MKRSLQSVSISFTTEIEEKKIFFAAMKALEKSEKVQIFMLIHFIMKT